MACVFCIRSIFHQKALLLSLSCYHRMKKLARGKNIQFVVDVQREICVFYFATLIVLLWPIHEFFNIIFFSLSFFQSISHCRNIHFCVPFKMLSIFHVATSCTCQFIVICRWTAGMKSSERLILTEIQR